jgi:hypothetical protein
MKEIGNKLFQKEVYEKPEHELHFLSRIFEGSAIDQSDKKSFFQYYSYILLISILFFAVNWKKRNLKLDLKRN